MLTKKAEVEFGIQAEPCPHSVSNGLKLKLGKWENTWGRDQPESPKWNFMFGKEKAAAQQSS